jgi:signal transduction histidine kinase
MDGPRTAGELRELAEHLQERHQALLEEWKEMVLADPASRTAATLSLTHFFDIAQKVLEDFGRRLRDGSDRETLEVEHSQAHGSHRWQQGYSLRELVREWGYLQRSVMLELERYGREHPGLDPETLAFARVSWLEQCNRSIANSVERFSAHQKAEAASLLTDLQWAVEDLRRAERERAQVWHEAAHDLRGNVGVVTATTSILAEEDTPEALRAKAMKILQSSTSSLLGLLEDLMGLARLEAGREQRKLEEIDAAALFRDLCLTLEPVAHERGLSLCTAGPASLPVEGDRAKLQRILQNLVLNALRYTERGGVRVSWGETEENDLDRWYFRVEDTGPGFHTRPGTPLADDLREATDAAREVETRPATGIEPVPAAGAPAPPSPLVRPGEGIGLLIVKRLCELLDASLELASTPAGSTFQVTLPRRYGG